MSYYKSSTRALTPFLSHLRPPVHISGARNLAGATFSPFPKPLTAGATAATAAATLASATVLRRSRR